MKVVAVMGVMGGAGGTTVAANLAAGLAVHKRPTLSFDFCPDNLLRLHFGLAWNEAAGFAPALLQAQEWQSAAFRSAAGLDFVPFGQLADETDLDRLSRQLSGQPGWFRTQLAALHLPEETVVVCDTPRSHPVLRAQVLRRADLVLLVCAPDAVSYAFATQMLANADAGNGPETMIVLSGFEPARRLDRDIAVLLRTGFKSRLSPAVIHRDEFLRESLACKQTVFEFAPSSQAAHDFGALATWTLSRLGHEERAHAH